MSADPPDSSSLCMVGRSFRLDDLPAAAVLELRGLNWVSPCPGEMTFTFKNLVPGRRVGLCEEHGQPVFTMIERSI